MLTFLFWNLKNGDLSASLTRLTKVYSVDVLILAECSVASDTLCNAMNAQNESAFHHVTIGGQGKSGIRQVEIFSRFDNSAFAPASDDNRYTIRYFRPPGREEIILAAAHLKSQLHSKPPDIENGVRTLSSAIQAVEAKAGHNRTLLVGDLNINPFDAIAVAADGLHGVMTKTIAQRGNRKVEKKQYPFFYNPMWRLLGDRNDTPAGSFYYDRGGIHCQFWHLFDQVMIRPSLIEEWDDDSLSLITGDGNQEFLRNGRPRGDIASDHLPLLFRLK